MKSKPIPPADLATYIGLLLTFSLLIASAFFNTSTTANQVVILFIILTVLTVLLLFYLKQRFAVLRRIYWHIKRLLASIFPFYHDKLLTDLLNNFNYKNCLL
jgi:hypothetical protein